MKLARNYMLDVLRQRLIDETDQIIDAVRASSTVRLFEPRAPLRLGWWRDGNDDPWALRQLGNPSVEGTVEPFTPNAIVATALGRSVPGELWAAMNVATAIKLLHGQRDAMLDAALRAVVDISENLTSPRLVRDVAASLDLLKSWPWPTEDTNWLLFRKLQRFARDGGNHPVPLFGAVVFHRDGWPGVEPRDVMRWAAPRLGLLAPGVMRTLDRDANEVREPGGRVMLGAFTLQLHGREVWVPVAALGHLFEVEKAIGMGSSGTFKSYPMSVDRVQKRVGIVLGGADPRMVEEDGAVAVEQSSDEGDALFTWAKYSMTLSVPSAGPADKVLDAIKQRYGDGAVRNLMCLMALAWAQRATPQEMIWWWPDDSLWLAGLKPTKEARRSMRQWLQEMSQVNLDARYAEGAPLRGGLVAIGESDGTAVRVHIHDALYRSIVTDEGLLGPYWWSMPTALLREPANGPAGKVHVMALVLGQMLRVQRRKHAGSSPVIAIERDKLARYLGVLPRTDRSLDRRVGSGLARCLDGLVKCGMLQSWRVEGPPLERSGGVIHGVPATAGDSLPRIPMRPLLLPATGEDLGRWLSLAGHSSWKAAEVLGVPDSTLRRLVVSHHGRPLPAGIRAALRQILWQLE